MALSGTAARCGRSAPSVQSKLQEIARFFCEQTVHCSQFKAGLFAFPEDCAVPLSDAMKTHCVCLSEGMTRGHKSHEVSAWLYNRVHKRKDTNLHPTRAHRNNHNNTAFDVRGELCMPQTWWLNGIWLRRDANTNEHFIGTKGSIVKARAIR